MRKKWYGDNRDLVKWSVLIQLARKHKIKTILQVAFYNPESQNVQLASTRYGSIELPQQVLDQFPRDLNDIKRLEETTGIRIQVFLEPFQKHLGTRHRTADGGSYVDKANEWINSNREGPLVVFLDPDTGIEPLKSDVTYKHVTAHELKRFFDALQPNDLFVLYQHAPRRKESNWELSRQQKLVKSIGLHSEDIVDRLTCKAVADDVAFFAIPRR